MKTHGSSSRLRVAIVPPLWARVAPATQGGVEYLVYLLAEELVKRGHEVTVFTSSDSPTTARIEALIESNLLEAMEKGSALEGKYYETCNLAEALQRSDEFDVIHFHAGCYAIPLAGFSRAPVLHTLHNPITCDAIWLLNRYPQAPVSAVSRNQIADIPKERRDNIRIIHNACNFDAYQFSASAGSYLTFLGRMASTKGVLEAIQVAKEAGLPIVLAGRPMTGKDRTYFNEKIKPLINDKDVHYIGHVDHQQKTVLLRDSAALLFPIQADEAFGLVMIEAMASGAPVLAFRRSAVEEIVDFGKTGFYADSIQELVSYVPRALGLDRTAVYKHAKRRFGHERMVDEYLQAYQAVISESWNGQAALEASALYER
jgi:glycosyltransferase involved in cell wall biosynthesis